MNTAAKIAYLTLLGCTVKRARYGKHKHRYSIIGPLMYPRLSYGVQNMTMDQHWYIADLGWQSRKRNGKVPAGKVPFADISDAIWAELHEHHLIKFAKALDAAREKWEAGIL